MQQETNISSLSRKFITPRRAIQEFLLRPSQLEDLPLFSRRSPFHSETTILVYNRADVVQRSIDIWGSVDALIDRRSQGLFIPKEKPDSKKKIKKHNLSDYSITSHKQYKFEKRDYLIFLAIIVDCLNFAFKLLVWLHTKSDSMFAEVIHSGADIFNQSILLIGIFKSKQEASAEHPYGFSNVMYVVSLISGVAIFCLGGAINCYTGLSTIFEKSTGIHIDRKSLHWAFIVLLFSFITEFIPFTITLISTFKTARFEKTPCFTYTFRGQDPSINVIILEDGVAVLGTLIAAGMLYWSWQYHSFYPDAAGSVIIGLLLGVVALILIISSSNVLVGRSITFRKLDAINRYLESDVMIRGIYDVKGIELGEKKVRYKGEIDFDGAELTRLYLDHININTVFEELKKIHNPQHLETFMIKHGEHIVDLMGREIDRIEKDLRKVFPEVRHVDLEIL